MCLAAFSGPVVLRFHSDDSLKSQAGGPVADANQALVVSHSRCMPGMAGTGPNDRTFDLAHLRRFYFSSSRSDSG